MLFFCVCLITISVKAQREFEMTEGDSTYTMKRYVFMHLLAGANRSQDSTEAAQLQVKHLKHLTKMAQSGKLAMAGPFSDGGEYRGLLIFDVETIAEAEELEGKDPMIQAGRLKMHSLYWWAAKGTSLP